MSLFRRCFFSKRYFFINVLLPDKKYFCLPKLLKISLMEKSPEEEMLRKFAGSMSEFPKFKNAYEEKIFLQLQKYNLIYVTVEGVFKLTKKGEEALRTDVQKFISLERFEERLVKDSLRRNIERKWLYFAVIPLIVLLAILLVTM